MESIEDLLTRECAKNCPDPLARVLRLIRAKWAVPLLVVLGDSEPLRYAVLQRQLAVPPKELARVLRIFEAEGLVKRTVFPTVPPAVEYALTDRGRSLLPALLPLASWAVQNQDVCTDRFRVMSAQ